MLRLQNIGCWIIVLSLAGCTTAAKRQVLFDAGANEALDEVELDLVEVQTQEALRQGAALQAKPKNDSTSKPEDPALKQPPPTKPTPKRQAPVASACTHLIYRNPVVDLIRIPAGLRGGVYVPTHYEYVVYHTGRWEVVSSLDSRQTTLPPFSSGCQAPPKGKQP